MLRPLEEAALDASRPALDLALLRDEVLVQSAGAEGREGAVHALLRAAPARVQRVQREELGGQLGAEGDEARVQGEQGGRERDVLVQGGGQGRERVGVRWGRRLEGGREGEGS